VEEIVEDEGVGQQGIYNNCRFYGNIICYITFISLLKINYFNYFFIYIMHAKTETNAQILSLLYPASPSRGVFKIKKNTKITRNSK